MSDYQFFNFHIENHVAHVAFNRPDKSNALNRKSWEEMKAIFERIDQTPEARVAILKGEGKHFCGGIDLTLLMDMQRFQQISCEGRKREALRDAIFFLQDCISAIEKCRKPVLAAVHSACLGAGVDVIGACDMRYSTDDAFFSIKEVDLGLVADIGTLQRLPKFMNYGVVAEMAYTGRNVSGQEAEKIGLVNRSFPNQAAMMEAVEGLAKTIAAKSPLVIRGTKEIIKYTRDHSVEESLNYMVAWNASMLFSNDLMEAFQASMEKRAPKFEN